MDTAILISVWWAIVGIVLLLQQNRRMYGLLQQPPIPVVVTPSPSVSVAPVPGLPAKPLRPHVHLVCMDKHERQLVETFYVDAGIRPHMLQIDGTRYVCTGGSAALGYFLYRGEA